jgi:phage RecT family recombinase
LADNPLVIFERELARRETQFVTLLGKSIDPRKFMRVISMAASRNPDLLMADRQSLINACMHAAQDGLLPDGREGVITVYNVNIAKKGEKDNWVKKAQWNPMAQGLLKKLYATGRIKGISTGIVYLNDTFRYTKGDDEFLVHEPNINDALYGSEDEHAIRAVYARAVLSTGHVEREVMTKKQIDLVRACSKNKTGEIWTKWFGQMAVAKVIRRLAKKLPLPDADTFGDEDDSHPDELPEIRTQRPEPVLPDDGSGPQLSLAKKEPPVPDDKPAEIEEDQSTMDHLFDLIREGNEFVEAGDREAFKQWWIAIPIEERKRIGVSQFEMWQAQLAGKEQWLSNHI